MYMHVRSRAICACVFQSTRENVERQEREAYLSGLSLSVYIYFTYSL